MNRSGRLLFSLLLAGWLPGYAGDPSMVRLLNGDRVQGEILRLEGTDLLLKPAWGGPVLRIPGHLTGHTAFAAAKSSSFTEDVRLFLQNGDEVPAKMQDFNGEQLVLESSWGQILRLNPAALHRMEIAPDPANRLMDSPGDLQHWEPRIEPGRDRIRPLEWTAAGLALSGRQGISRPLPPLNGKSFLRFRVTQQGFGHLALVFEDPGEGRNSGSMMRFMLSNRQIHYQFHQGQARPQNIERWSAHAEVEDFGEPVTSEFTLYIDPEQGDLWMKWNERVVQQWNNPMLRQPVGPEIRLQFHVQLQQHSVVLQGVEWGSWSGANPERPPAPDAVGMPVFLLRNFDQFSAEWMGWEAGQFQLTGPGRQPLTLSRQQLQAVYFPHLDFSPFRMNRRDVHVRLTGGERFTLALQELTDTSLTGTADAWAEPLVIPRERILYMRWNIHSRIRLDDNALDEYL